MNDRVCFVIAPLGDAESEVRRRSDQMLRHVISPAVESCGYKAVRADQIAEPGMITSQVIQHVVEDPLVIADLTGRNPNVFYELAIRHAIRKPLVQIIAKGEQIPFDVAGTRTVFVDHRDLDSVDAARREIMNQIKSLELDPGKLESPISVSLDLQQLKRSDKPEERTLADVLSAITDVRNGILSLEKRMDVSESQLTPVLIDEIRQLFVRRRVSPVAISDLIMAKDELEAVCLQPQATDRQKDALQRLEKAVGHLRSRIDHDEWVPALRPTGNRSH